MLTFHFVEWKKIKNKNGEKRKLDKNMRNSRSLNQISKKKKKAQKYTTECFW